MSKRVKVAKICLQIDGKEISLTLKQAQELKNVLNDTFGETVTEYIYPYYGHPRSYTLTSPGIQRDVWCGTTSNTVAMSSANIAGQISSTGTMTLAMNP